MKKRRKKKKRDSAMNNGNVTKRGKRKSSLNEQEYQSSFANRLSNKIRSRKHSDNLNTV